MARSAGVDSGPKWARFVTKRYRRSFSLKAPILSPRRLDWTRVLWGCALATAEPSRVLMEDETVEPKEDQELEADDLDSPRYEDGSVIDPPPEPNPTRPDSAE
jgi:hypothetical protein